MHQKIIALTPNDGTDQDHFEVHHLSRSHDISDRTKFLLDEIDQNPADGMFRTLQACAASAKLLKRNIVFGVPCNTFHAPKIFESFEEQAQKLQGQVQILNMLNENYTRH